MAFVLAAVTIDMMFAVSQVKEKKCTEQQVDLYSVFIDLTKALDIVQTALSLTSADSVLESRLWKNSPLKPYLRMTVSSRQRENHPQTIVDRFAEASRLFGLTITLGKMKVLDQAAPNTIRAQPHITIEAVQLKCVESFKYLGSTISSNGLLDREISSRIHKASQELGRLKVKVLQQKGVRVSTKLKVYRVVVVSILLYGCETWTTYRWHIKQLEQFHTRALCMIVGIRLQDRVTNQEVLDRAGLTSIESTLLKAQLCWTGHVIRMSVCCSTAY